MPYPGEPGFAFYGTARDELPRSKPYERHDLLNTVTPFKHMEFRKEDGEETSIG